MMIRPSSTTMYAWMHGCMNKNDEKFISHILIPMDRGYISDVFLLRNI